MESGIEGNLPPWKGASAVYSKAYRMMEEHGADDCLIKALAMGDEEPIKACLLRIIGSTLERRILKNGK